MQFIYYYVNIKNVNDGIIKITHYDSIFNVIVDEKDDIVSGETKIKSGDRFFINFKQEKILFFDYESHEGI